MTLDHLIHSREFLADLCGAGAFGVVVLIWMALVEKDPLPSRLKNISAHRSELFKEGRDKKASRRKDEGQISIARKVVQKLKLEQGKKLTELRLKLARAGYRSREGIFTYLFLRMALPPGLAFFAFFCVFILHISNLRPLMGLLTIVIAGIFGLLLPDIFLKNQSQKRETVLRKAMPDAFDLMVICAEAGLSLDATFDRVSREMGNSCPELAEEIGLTGVELGFLPDRSKALQNLADRVPVGGVLALTNTLIQTERYGTPLAQSLRVLSAEMREERMMAAETKAAKLPATLTVPMILFILPPLFVVLIGPAVISVMELKK